MSKRAEPPAKKPSGGRPIPRRLFSIDSLRKEKSTSNTASTVSQSSSQNGPLPTVTEKATTQSADDPFSDPTNWTEKPLVSSPPLDEQHDSVSIRTLTLSLDQTTPRPFSDASLGPPPSPSRRRWDTIRSHVLPAINSTDDPLLSPPADKPSLPTRPSTPKLHRFQKKGLRQVVDTVTTNQQVQRNEHQRFAEAIRKACWSARFGETLHQVKHEREGTLNTVGSTLHLPFMASTTSLQVSSSSSSSTIQATGKSGGLRRPQSVQSLAFAGRIAPSVTHIVRVLSSFATSAEKTSTLPHEPLVLSALLLPFLSPREGTQIELEQTTALEIFEYIVQTWQAQSREAELGRCIWCCNAASAQSKLRMRVLGTLSSLLFARDRAFSADSPMILQTLIQALISLKYCLSFSLHSTSEMLSLAEYVAAVRQSSCGELSHIALEMEFGVRFSSSEDEVLIREAVIAESLIKCLDMGSVSGRWWILRTLLEDYWPIPKPTLSPSPLLSCVYWRKLKTFLSSVLTLLSHPVQDAQADVQIIVSLLYTRVLPEVAIIAEEDATEIRSKIVLLTLELLSVLGNEQNDLLTQFCDWYQQPDWKSSVERAMSDLFTKAEWPYVLRLISSVVSELPLAVQVPLVAFILPLLNTRILSRPPDSPCPQLTHFLEFVSRSHPKVFFKPLFICAAASKDATIVSQLCVLRATAKYMPDFWIRDPEMMAVALMSDANGSRSTSNEGTSTWASARVGQSALLVELVEHLHSIHDRRDLAMTSAAVKFSTALESRVGIIIDAKEKSLSLPPSQRLLFCSLFREMRLLTRSLKPASWLQAVISWVLQWDNDDANISREDLKDEVYSTMHKLQAVYAQVRDGFRRPSHRRTTTSMSALEKQASEKSDTPKDKSDPLVATMKRLSEMTDVVQSTILELLVTVSALLTPEQFRQLGPVLWIHCMDEPHAPVVASTCFLIMQFAEKQPEEFTALIETGLASEEAHVRRQTIQRIGILSSWRFQILSQDVILDRNHRRPFKLQRPPVLFVATDIGSSLFVYEDDSDYKDINGHVIPVELRRRLSEIGWAQEDRVVDQRIQRIRTPMSLLPSQQLERLDTGNDELLPGELQSVSPEPSPTKSPTGDTSLVRRDSTPVAKSQGVKRRPVFVSALVALFPKLASMVADRDLIVASAAQELIADFMRDDPSLLSRTVFHLITGDEPSLTVAISTLRAFLHIRHALPPGMAHHILNHLTGYLKSSVRQADTSNPLRGYAYTIPVIAKLVNQVSKISIREIRRAKVDFFLIPSGSLWFPQTVPVGPLFPRVLEASHNRFENVPPSLIWITLIRTSQNMLFSSMLKRNPQDIKVIRKSMTRLVLPSLHPKGDDVHLTLMDMVPCRHENERDSHSTASSTLIALSLTLARSYLLLVEQIFHCMSRHLNDREELAIFIDGLNRILLVHGDDIGIVAHTMLALMTASTRFKRLFISGGGYALFMPAVMKTYVEAEYHGNIRYTIEYAANRFYALHQESFIFQSFDVMAQILDFPHVDGPWIAGGIYALFSTLKGGVSASTPDAAGIHDLNKAQEQEALMVTLAEEVPQTFLASLKRGNQDKHEVSIPVREEYEGKRLRLDDLVRLFLTVIAHNPAIQRAQQFLKFLRLLCPHLHDASRSAQTVLRGGIDALGSILLSRTAIKPKVPESAQIRPADELSYEVFAEKPTTGQRSAPSDLLNMRLEYLDLVLAFTSAGGQVANVTTLRIIDVVKAIMKDSRSNGERISIFLADYVRTVLVRKAQPPSTKDVVALLDTLAPAVSAYSVTVNFAGVYDVLIQLVGNAVLASEPAFVRLVSQYCRIGLEACELVASEGLLFDFPLRVSLVKLLNAAVSIAGSQVVDELERRIPTYDFFCGILFPMVLTLKTSADIIADSQWTDGWRRGAYTKVWLRLLSFVLTTCEKGHSLRTPEKSSSLPGLERRKSQDHRTPAEGSGPLMAFTMALQTLKIIVIRAEDDISSTSPGLWAHIGMVLRSLLSDGDATFAFKFHDYSEPPSPAFSPRVSTFSEQQHVFPTFPSSASMHTRRSFLSPRLVDYLTWSLVQWLLLRRSPLMISMRIFVQERVANLATELQLQGTTVISGSGTRSRRVSTVFSKPRRSMFGHSPTSSAASTPRNSALINNSLSLPVINDFVHNLSPSKSGGRQAGYARMPSPISPSGRTSQDLNGHKIVHLGPITLHPPTDPTGFTRPVSPGGTTSGAVIQSLRAMAKETIVRSPGLVRTTYRRIRLVQQLMGYSELLPMGGSEYLAEENIDTELRVWSKRDAVDAVVSETNELMDEFRDGDGDLGDESAVMVDSQDFLLPE